MPQRARPIHSFLPAHMRPSDRPRIIHLSNGGVPPPAKRLASAESLKGWLRNVPPASCYGSEAKVAAWVALHQRSVKLRDCPTWQDFVREWEAIR